MKKILFILIFILFNNVVVFWNIEESKTATWYTIAKQISTEELNKNIKKAELEQLEEIIKNDSNLEKKLIWEFKKSNLSLNNFLENYYLNKNKVSEKQEVTEIEKDEKYNKKNIWKEIEVNKITEKNNLQINNEKKENILYNSFLKYLPILNLILIIIIMFLFYYLFNKKN